MEIELECYLEIIPIDILIIILQIIGFPEILKLRILNTFFRDFVVNNLSRIIINIPHFHKFENILEYYVYKNSKNDNLLESKFILKTTEFGLHCGYFIETDNIFIETSTKILIGKLESNQLKIKTTHDKLTNAYFIPHFDLEEYDSEKFTKKNIRNIYKICYKTGNIIGKILRDKLPTDFDYFCYKNLTFIITNEKSNAKEIYWILDHQWNINESKLIKEQYINLSVCGRGRPCHIGFKDDICEFLVETTSISYCLIKIRLNDGKLMDKKSDVNCGTYYYCDGFKSLSGFDESISDIDSDHKKCYKLETIYPSFIYDNTFYWNNIDMKYPNRKLSIKDFNDKTKNNNLTDITIHEFFEAKRKKGNENLFPIGKLKINGRFLLLSKMTHTKTLQMTS